MLQEGYILGERYEILERIGSGGMAFVYKARDTKLNRYVAIKVLRKENYDDELFVRKFDAEAEATAMLTHPNIVSIYDSAFTDGFHYIVMELAEGMTLKRYIRRYGRLSARETVDISIQIARGLEAAHERKIVHRDIKPQNILVSDSGTVKITDFGIAKAATGDTISSANMGSVHYLSPEQAKGGYVDKRSDIYSLGITMYEMATGRVPFDGENSVAIALMHIKNDMVPPREYFPDIPESLQRIILKCTSKMLINRYQDASQLIDDLEHVFTSPDGNYVFLEDGVEDESPTINRDQAEIERIKRSLAGGEEARRGNRQKPDDPRYRNDPEGDRFMPETEDDEDHEDDDRSRKGMQNVVGIAAILAGVLLAGLLIYAIGTGLSGFPFGTGQGESTTQKEETTTAATEEKTEAPQNVTVPDVLGLTRKKAARRLEKEEFVVEFLYEKGYSEKDKGLVVLAQTPEPGQTAEKKSVVSLTLGVSEEDYVNIPDLIGKKEEKAEKDLEELGLKANVAYASSDTVEAGYVMDQNPVSGAKVAKGFAVTITVSKGLEDVRVPSLYGMSQTAAKRQLESVGLELGDVSSDYSGEVGVNDVISQSIDPGTYVEKGTKVSIVISIGEPTTIRYEGKISITDSPFEEEESGTVELILSQSGEESVIYEERTLSRADFPLSLTFEGKESGSGTVIMKVNGENYEEFEVTLEAIAR